MSLAVPRPADCYRLPWSLNDNVLGWLEPTKHCNLYCEGCYSRNQPQSGKPLGEIREDLRHMVAHRKMDSISIAGGDPLTHDGVVDIVRMVHEEFGLKPVINTNGLALDEGLLRELKDAGLHGFTFHIDSSQHRPGWKGKSEAELNELRLRLAKMVDEVGDLSCAFNMTVFRDTVDQVPVVLDWARDHMDIVHGVVFILFRTARAREFTYLADGQPVEVDDLVYYGQEKNPRPLTTPELLATLREREPDLAPAAYLGGTCDPETFKWAVAGRIGRPGHVHGYVGARYMEAVQAGHHAWRGKYLAYAHPSLMRHGRSMMALFSTLDQGTRRAAARWVGEILRSPSKAAKRAYFQSVVFIQPIDMMPGGEMNMCDGCPDITVHTGADGKRRLAWSCRLEELMQHGCFLTATPCGGGTAG